jgi:hypothetical protein
MSSKAFELAQQDFFEALKVYDDAGYKHRTMFEVPRYTLDLSVAAGGKRESSQMGA